MGAPKPPAPPDPKETAAAQTGTNVSTAVANAYLGNVNQVTPYGNLTYNETGTKTVTDGATGKQYEVPIFTATQELSPEQQAIQDRLTGAQTNLAGIAEDQSGFLQNYLNTPFDGSNEATEARLMELGRKRLDPVLSERNESVRTRLANQGIKAGSEAYDREMRNLTQGENDAYNSLLLSGRQQAYQEALTERNQPLNEIGALMSGSQVSQPNFVNSNMPTIPTTDYAGLVNENYNQRLGAWQQQASQRQGMLGGLLGFAGSLATPLIGLSDERAKENVKEVGTLKGHKLFEYDYKDETGIPGKHIGVMAQKVEKKRPDAVLMGADGYRRVDYGKLFGAGVS